MKNRILSLLLLSFIPAAGVYAQQGKSASASQTVELHLAPAIALTFGNTGTSSGAQVSLAFTNVNQLTTGIVSANQELSVQSNKPFKVSVQTDAAAFAYSGTASGASMPVSDILFMSVKGNQTGGNVAGAFNNNYKSLEAASQDILLDGQNGSDQKIVVAYKAKPGMSYPAGNYTVGVIYTATQP